MRPRIKFQKNGTSVPFFFFARYPKSKMNSRIVMPSTKQKHKIKKFFSRNIPPVYTLQFSSIWGKTQSL
jgi:hypothetical protein